ncbi:hypothetical protein M758_4G214900 [Ceratodon purpureus]|nr:hypothetical protein M758_4G214900 [Ceratodon purpureus]
MNLICIIDFFSFLAFGYSPWMPLVVRGESTFWLFWAGHLHGPPTREYRCCLPLACKPEVRRYKRM